MTQSCTSFLRIPHRARAIGAGLLALGVLIPGWGCQSGEQTAADDQGAPRADVNAGATDTTDPAPDPERILDEMRSHLDERFTVGPTAADQINYRVVWNTQARMGGGGSTVSIGHIAGDSLFIIDSSNTLTRILRENGKSPWSWPVGDLGDRILGVRRTIADNSDWTLVMSQTDLHVVQTDNGVQVNRMRFERVASTAPTIYGESIIYGSVSGQVVWFNYVLNAYMGGNTMAGAVSVPPQILGNVVLAVSSRGHIMALHAANGARLWDKAARGAVEAVPAMSEEAVYVSSIDQYLYCFDIRYGDVIWKRLHSAPLREPPVLIGEFVYVRTPDLGLTCYKALPYDDLDGERMWNTTKVTGTVVGQIGGRLLTWDSEDRVMTLVDAGGGEVITTVPLPKVSLLILSEFENGEIYAVSEQGMVTKLVPRT